MGAHLYPFPAPSADRCQAVAAGANAVAGRLDEQHAPVLCAAAQLLDLDDAAFALRLEVMRDAEGGALVHDLCVALRHAANDFDVARQATFLARARLAAGIASYGGINDEH